jgi:hypothetical protein
MAAGVFGSDGSIVEKLPPVPAPDLIFDAVVQLVEETPKPGELGRAESIGNLPFDPDGKFLDFPVNLSAFAREAEARATTVRAVDATTNKTAADEQFDGAGDFGGIRRRKCAELRRSEWLMSGNHRKTSPCRHRQVVAADIHLRDVIAQTGRDAAEAIADPVLERRRRMFTFHGEKYLSNESPKL